MAGADPVWEVLAQVGSVRPVLAREALIPIKWGRARSRSVQAVLDRAALAEEALIQMVSAQVHRGLDPAVLAQAGLVGEPWIQTASAQVHRDSVLADGVDVAPALGPWESACQTLRSCRP